MSSFLYRQIQFRLSILHLSFAVAVWDRGIYIFGFIYFMKEFRHAGYRSGAINIIIAEYQYSFIMLESLYYAFYGFIHILH